MHTTASIAATIPSNYSRLIARELGLQKKDLHQLLQGTGLNADDLLQENTCLSEPQQLQIIRNALRISQRPYLGLDLGRRLTPLTHGAVGYLANSCPNLLTAAQAIAAYVPTRMSFARLKVEKTLTELVVQVHFTVQLDADCERFLCECLAQAFFVTAEFIVGQALTGASIDFPFAKPSYSDRYASALPVTVSFSAPQLAICAPLTLCYEPNASANQENYQLAKRQCEQMLAQLDHHQNSYRTRVQKLILSHPPGALNEDGVAQALFISKRTLARHLTREGSSFRQVRDAILSQQAAAYLVEGQLSVEAIANLLQYSDSANFRRAFKRWFGQTPQQYKQQRTQSEDSQR